MDEPAGADLMTRIFHHLETDDVESALMACLRLARSTNDYLSAAIFQRELFPDKKEAVRVLYDDTSHLRKDAQKFLYDTSLDRWLETHTVDTGQIDRKGNPANVLVVAAGHINAEIQQWERSIDDMALPAGMGQFDTAAFADRLMHEKAEVRLRIRALLIIKSRVKARCLNYAIQMQRQLGLQQRSQGFLETVQNDVHNFFKARSDDVYAKLQKVAQLAVSQDKEDASLLLTEVRRALRSAADFLYPPIEAKVLCSDGTERKLGADQYLNRLQEFLTRLPNATSTQLLRTELEYLANFLRRLNETASKGVHASASFEEAKQGSVGLYFFLFNVCHHLTVNTEAVV